jgi:hypothetical protein
MMKKIALLLSILMVSVIVAAQGSPIDKLFNKYSGNDGFTTVLVNQDMFEIFSKMEKAEGDIEGDIGGVMGNIKKVRVLAQEDEEGNTKGINFMDELNGMDFNEYKELIKVRESDEEVLILAREEGNKFAELLIIVSGDDNVLVSVEGLFSMSDLGSLSKLEGLENLDVLE